MTQHGFDFLRALHGPTFDEFDEDPAGAAKRGELVAALRLFLRFYREEKPEILSELYSIRERQKAGLGEEDEIDPYQAWFEKFGLPPHSLMLDEVMITIIGWEYSRVMPKHPPGESGPSDGSPSLGIQPFDTPLRFMIG